MAKPKASLANRMEGGYFQKTDAEESRNIDVLESHQPPVPRAKRTYHLPTSAILLLEEIQLEEFKRTGKKPDLSDLVAESISVVGKARPYLQLVGQVGDEDLSERAVQAIRQSSQQAI